MNTLHLWLLLLFFVHLITLTFYPPLQTPCNKLATLSPPRANRRSPANRTSAVNKPIFAPIGNLSIRTKSWKIHLITFCCHKNMSLKQNLWIFHFSRWKRVKEVLLWIECLLVGGCWICLQISRTLYCVWKVSSGQLWILRYLPPEKSKFLENIRLPTLRHWDGEK